MVIGAEGVWSQLSIARPIRGSVDLNARCVFIGTKMAFQLTSSNSSSFVAGKEECSAGARPPLGPGAGHGRIPCANSPHKTGTPRFHTLVCRRRPGWVIGTKMTSPALQREFENHQFSQSSLV